MTSVRYVLARLLAACCVVALVLMALSLLVSLIPGDPTTVILGPRAPEGLRADVRAEMGLDEPVWVQIWRFASAALTGDLGTDFASHTPVLDLVSNVLPHTLLLALSSLLVMVVVGLPLGVLAATRPGGMVDKLITGVSVVFVTMPPYVAGLLLLILFAVTLQALPAVGAGDLARPVDYLRHLVLPAVALALAWVGYVARILRASMIEVLASPHVRAARAFGVRRRTIDYRYALRIAVIPTVAVLGVSMGSLVGGAIFVEVIFSRPGLGSLIYEAVQNRNVPVLRGGVLVLVALCVLANLVADLVNRFLDPRTRLAGGRR